ncbi:MAG TPA: DNA polymerase III subunit alpha, partial [Acholeplasma sp.]|nr:DNA polymerase III subunit alpha [Acholeplasma sp.]
YLKSQDRSLTLEQLIKHQKGLIVVSAGYNSLIDQTILYGNEKEVVNYINKYNEVFDDFYLGLSINYEIQRKVSIKYLYNLAIENNYKMLLSHQTNYLKNEDKYVYEALTKIVDINNEVSEFADFSMLSFEDAATIFAKYPELLKHQTKLINDINFSLPKIKYEMPTFKNKNNINSKDFLHKLAHAGLSRRLKLSKITNYKPYVERLNHELNVIKQMNFENYFLIVYDFVKYAKQNNILVGPGRGSAAGSLVSYTLGITDIDPIKYNLMFERFLNPERTSMPDIDLDFPDNKRDEVINYVKEKYGEEHIASITTFSTLQVKSSIRDISRVLKIPLDRVSGIIQAVEKNRVDKTDFEVAKVLDIASKISGLYRQTGTHAAGIILAENNLFESIPMQKGAFKFAQSQYDMETLEKLGLIKIDFLGIRNLTTIADIIENLKFKGIKIDLNNLSLNDKKTYDLLSIGNTTGIFQLESGGMRRVLQKLKPQNFEDIVATLALYRPGPMANIDIYISRKNGAKFSYLHNDLKEILSPTYGIIIYQEQIMQIA